MRTLKTIFIYFAIFSVFCSCNNKPSIKEIIYKVDSVGQFKSYLKGHWYRPIHTDSTNYFYSFEFQSNSFGVFQDVEETSKGNYKTFSCAPAFKITQNKQDFYVEFIDMFQKKDTSNKYKIVQVSNKKFIIKNKVDTLIYNKKED